MVKYSRKTHRWPDSRFETERFFLCSLGAEHEPGMFEMFSSEDFTRYVPFELFTDREKARTDFLTKIAEGERFKFHLAIEWKVPIDGDHNMAGFAMVRPSEDGAKMEIGYCVVPRFWGRGIGTEATKVLVDVIAPELGGKKEDLVAKIHPENIGSIRLAEKCGFQLMEETCDETGPHLVLHWKG